MKPTLLCRVLLGVCLSLASLACVDAHATTLDVVKFLAQRGADNDGSSKIRSPTPDMAPLVFTDKNAYASSCGLLVARPRGSRPAYVRLTGPEGDANFPDCMGILSLTQFKLSNREYVAVEYLSRETREDVYRQFKYLVRDSDLGYVVDEGLYGKGEAGGVQAGASSRPALGIKEARIAALKKTFSHWQLQERDVISDQASSFAVFADRKSQQCHVVAEAGALPVTAHLTDYVPGARCAGALASTRLAKSGATYYLALFKSDSGKRIVTVTAVSADGKITTEKGLSDALNASGAARDIGSAKSALADALR